MMIKKITTYTYYKKRSSKKFDRLWKDNSWYGNNHVFPAYRSERSAVAAERVAVPLRTAAGWGGVASSRMPSTAIP